MRKKKIVIALGHEALGTTLPDQKTAAKKTAKAVADLIEADYQVVISHSNGPQVGMIHTAMSEFCKLYPEYTATPLPDLSRVHGNPDVCLFCDEPGVYRL